MRTYVVLGFATSSKNETGKELYLGPDRSKAMAETNDSSGTFARKEFHELPEPILVKQCDEAES
jgi:hypothetical protein